MLDALEYEGGGDANKDGAVKESLMICAAERGSSVEMSRPSIRRHLSCSIAEKQLSHVLTSSTPVACTFVIPGSAAAKRAKKVGSSDSGCRTMLAEGRE